MAFCHVYRVDPDALDAWTGEAQPAVAFYERLGGKPLRDQMVDIGGLPLRELAYEWEDLRGLEHRGLGETRLTNTSPLL